MATFVIVTDKHAEALIEGALAALGERLREAVAAGSQVHIEALNHSVSVADGGAIRMPTGTFTITIQASIPRR